MWSSDEHRLQIICEAFFLFIYFLTVSENSQSTLSQIQIQRPSIVFVFFGCAFYNWIFMCTCFVQHWVGLESVFKKDTSHQISSWFKFLMPIFSPYKRCGIRFKKWVSKPCLFECVWGARLMFLCLHLMCIVWFVFCCPSLDFIWE